MKKTLDINLSGRMFHVDEDAYQLLYDYLYNLRHAFERQEGGNEIMDDLENRLAELLLERISDRQEVVSRTIVQETIARLGQPEEIAGTTDAEPRGEEASASEEPSTENKEAETDKEKEEEQHDEVPPHNHTEFTGRKRLFRDPDNRMLGGVLGGLAVYMNWDPTLLRLLLLIILVAGYGTVVPVYLVCWLVIPKAETAADRLSMQGRPITMENIGKMVTEGMDKAESYLHSDRPRTALQRFADAFVAVAGFLLKVLLVIIAIICSPVLLVAAVVCLALIVALFAVLFGGTAALASLPGDFWTHIQVPGDMGWGLAFCIALIVGIGLLLICLISGVCTLAFKWKGLSPRSLKVMLAIGLVSLLLSGIFYTVSALTPEVNYLFP